MRRGVNDNYPAAAQITKAGRREHDSDRPALQAFSFFGLACKNITQQIATKWEVRQGRQLGSGARSCSCMSGSEFVVTMRCDGVFKIKHSHPCIISLRPTSIAKQPRYRLTQAVVNKQRSTLQHPLLPASGQTSLLAASLQLILNRSRLTNQIGSDASSPGRSRAVVLGHKDEVHMHVEINATSMKDPVAPFELRLYTSIGDTQACKCRCSLMSRQRRKSNLATTRPESGMGSV
jgi:hypothetical protein